MSEQTWSKAWKRSKNPGKQRKYRANAPYHQRSQFLSARLDDDVRDKVDTKTLPLREGDKVTVQRGDYAGATGDVREIDYDNYKIYIEGVKRDTVSGSETTVPIDPSNVVVTKLNLDDDMRVEKYGLTDAEREAISVEAAEPEDEDEDEEDTDAADDDAVETAEPEHEDETADDDITDSDTSEEPNEGDGVDYEELVQETVADVKDRVRDDELDPAQVLAAEKEHKNRSTLVDWLENRTEDDN